MLADEVREAEGHIFFSPRPRTVAERLGTRHTGWDGPGEIAVSPTGLRFSGPTVRRTTRATIEAVVRADDLVWIRRRAAHDWLVRCRRPVDTRALERALISRRA